MFTRIATPEDAVELARLNQAFNGRTDPPEVIAARLAVPGEAERAVLVEIDGHVVGFACLRLVPRILNPTAYAELTELYVEASYRRQGAGRVLVEHVERLARQAGAKEVFLLTDFDNQTGQAFYRALGYFDDALAMKKIL